MKIDAAYCDVHTDQKMAQTNFKVASRSNFTQEKVLLCTRKGCKRHFHYDFGYFDFTPTEEPDYGVLTAKPSCRLKHDLIFMLLTKIDNEPIYACFQPECPITAPYKRG